MTTISTITRHETPSGYLVTLSDSTGDSAPAPLLTYAPKPGARPGAGTTAFSKVTAQYSTSLPLPPAYLPLCPYCDEGSEFAPCICYLSAPR